LKLVAELNPQCAQSAVPSAVRLIFAGVTALLTESDPCPAALTVTVKSSVEANALSLPVNLSTYVPVALKLAVVFNALALPNVTVPGPLTVLHVVVNVAGGFGNPSSVAVPFRFAADGSVIV
jgi:hypothetical protein